MAASTELTLRAEAVMTLDGRVILEAVLTRDGGRGMAAGRSVPAVGPGVTRACGREDDCPDDQDDGNHSAHDRPPIFPTLLTSGRAVSCAARLTPRADRRSIPAA
jgi:hypothetical protein